MRVFRPLVSIVIPVYNGANYLREAIDSALAQTYGNTEILVINDGSTDGTEGIALSYGSKIRYFAKENGGTATALNLGVENMKGEYFSWLSHDDLYAPEKIEKNIEAVKACPERIVYSDYANINEKGELTGIVSAKALHRSADFEFGLFPVICGLVHGCSLLIHRSQFEKHGLFDESLKTTHDYDLWFKMFREQRLIYIFEPLVKNRVHQNQISRNSYKTVPEGESLWVNMFKSLTDSEMRAVGCSQRHFWAARALFMKNETSYKKASEYAFERLNECVNELRGALVSVIMPVYNKIPLAVRAVESVLNQSYQNWELLLVNDGSTDSIAPIEQLISSNNRIKLLNIEHAGVSRARNTGIASAKGKFVAFLDSDDTWNAAKLEKQLDFMLQNNFSMSHTYYNRVGDNEKFIETVSLPEFSGDVFALSLYSCGIATPCVIIEREFLGAFRFPQGVDYGEDVCLWLELAWRGKWGCFSQALASVYTCKASSFQNIRKQQLGSAEILRYVLKKPEWAAFQTEISIMVQNFRGLFPRRDTALPQTEGLLSEYEELFLKREELLIKREELTLKREELLLKRETALLKLKKFRGLSRYNLPRRLYGAVRRRGVIGVWRVFWRRVKARA